MSLTIIFGELNLKKILLKFKKRKTLQLKKLICFLVILCLGAFQLYNFKYTLKSHIKSLLFS